MKKILFAFFLFLPTFVFASEVNLVDTGIEVTKTNPTGTTLTLPFEYHYIDGKIGYCIEPGVIVGSNNYEATEDFSFYIPKEKKEKIQLIHYYGYERNPTLAYYMASQELIWEEMGAQNVIFRDIQTKEVISTERIKQAILEKVNNHYTLPSYANKIFERYVGEIFTLPYYDDRYSSLEYKGPTWGFTTATELTKVFHFSQNTTPGVSLLYYSSGEQTLATLHLSEEQKRSFDVTVIFKEKKGKIIINKTGDQVVGIENGKFLFETKPLDNVIYGIYAKEDIILKNGRTKYRKDTLIKKVETKGGYAVFDQLYYGNYYVKELLVNENYEINSTVYEFVIDDNHKEVSFQFHNKRKFIHILIHKKGELLNHIQNNTGVYEYGDLSDVTFELYLDEDIIENGQLILKKGTLIDEKIALNGEIIFESLICARYRIVEKENSLYKPIVNQIIDGNESKEIEILNVVRKGNLTIIKINEEKKRLPFVTFQIYKENQLLGEYTTDKNGEIKIYDLPIGQYRIKEIKTIDGYQIDPKEYFVEVREDQNVEIQVINQKYIMPITSDIDHIHFTYGFVFCFLGIIIYGIQKHC